MFLKKSCFFVEACCFAILTWLFAGTGGGEGPVGYIDFANLEEADYEPNFVTGAAFLMGCAL